MFVVQVRSTLACSSTLGEAIKVVNYYISTPYLASV